MLFSLNDPWYKCVLDKIVTQLEITGSLKIKITLMAALSHELDMMLSIDKEAYDAQSSLVELITNQLYMLSFKEQSGQPFDKLLVIKVIKLLNSILKDSQGLVDKFIRLEGPSYF